MKDQEIDRTEDEQSMAAQAYEEYAQVQMIADKAVEQAVTETLKTINAVFGRIFNV